MEHFHGTTAINVLMFPPERKDMRNKIEAFSQNCSPNAT